MPHFAPRAFAPRAFASRAFGTNVFTPTVGGVGGGTGTTAGVGTSRAFAARAFAGRAFAPRAFGGAFGATTVSPGGGVGAVAGTSRAFAARGFAVRAFPARAFGGGVAVAGGAITDLSFRAFTFVHESGPQYLLTAMTPLPKRLFLRNAYLVRERVTTFDAVTGGFTPVAGLTLTAFLTDTPTDDAPLDPGLALTLTEGPAGTYTGTLDPDAVAALAPFVNRTVYEIVTDGAGIRVYYAVLVLDRREGA